MKIKYVNKRFDESSLETIAQANAIIEEYAAQGYTLTLRQLYYQFVARGYIPNNMQSYKRLGSIINDGRLAGLIDWRAIEDRTRNLSRLSTWNGPSEIVEACAQQYREDLWEDQGHHVEVWVEKEALAGVVQRAAEQYQVSWFCEPERDVGGSPEAGSGGERRQGPSGHLSWGSRPQWH